MASRKTLVRWSALPFASAVVFFVAAYVVYWPLHGAAVTSCPSKTTLATTDLSNRDYTSYSDWCAAPWYKFAEGGAFLIAVFAAAILSGAVASKVAPTHKRIAGTTIFLLALVAIAVQL